MIKTHHIEEEKRKSEEMKSTKASEAPATVMEQFDRMKEKHPDAILLFRAGDFYETYRQDAVKASQILGITTANRKNDGQEIKIAGFPHHALDTYLPKLFRAGMRVAICEQLEDPKQKKVEKEKHTNNKEAKVSESEKPQLTDSAMPKKKKKEEAPEQEQPKAKVETKPEAKAEVKSEQKAETQQERKPREPQMVTVNGDKVTHGHAFQSKTNPEDWYFTAKINGEQLKPQKMDPADPTKGCYENHLTTGTRIDGEIITLEAIRKYAPLAVYEFRKALSERRNYTSGRFDFRGYDGSLWLTVVEKDDGYYRKGDIGQVLARSIGAVATATTTR